jgi:hypothetical protein
MIFNGSNVAFRRSVRSIATLEEYQKPDEAISRENRKPSKIHAVELTKYRKL